MSNVTLEQMQAFFTNMMAQAQGQTAETAVPELQLSEDALKAKAARDKSIEDAAVVMSNKWIAMMDELGFTVDSMASQNAQSGRQAIFTYNSTRSTYERAVDRLNRYQTLDSSEINLGRIRQEEMLMESCEVRMEEQEIINRAAQISADVLFDRFTQSLQGVDPDERGRKEDQYLQYNMVTPITEQQYQVYVSKQEQKFAQRNKLNREQAAHGAHLVRTTERKTQIAS